MTVTAAQTNIYLNGILDSGGRGITDGRNNEPLLIGTDFSTPCSTELDEVEIFNRALTQFEVKAIYLAGSGGKCKCVPRDCDDGLDCTTDTCLPTGCTHTPFNPYPSDPCPPAGSTTTRLYAFYGNTDGTNGAWCLREPCCFEAKDLNVPGAIGTGKSGMEDLRQKFVDSVTDLNCSNLKAGGEDWEVTGPDTSGKYTAEFWIRAGTCGTPFEFKVGKGGASSCNSNTMSVVLEPPNYIDTAAQYNPDVYEIPLPGLDCNGNDMDDFIDILDGTSQDANGDGVPDECETGACCDTLNGVCSEGILAGDCVADQRIWTYGASCAEVECVDPTIIPTVTAWGLVVMTLLVMTAGTVMIGRRRRPAAA